MTAVTFVDPRAARQRPHPHRFRLHRAGICNVWQYGEQVFEFEDGRLLLRGKNGAGKSKALELLLPFLLDGDVKRLDATGAGRTTFRWLMSEGATGVNRQGFLWLELRRQAADGTDQFLTLGAIVRWSSATSEARLAYFITPLRVGVDVALVVDGQPVSVDRLREKLGDGAILTTARDYRSRVGREVFGIHDPGRYRNLVHLLYRLRRPTIGDRIEAGQLANELAEALPPLDDDVLDSVAHNLDDLETVREDLGRLERTHAALSELMTSYRGYLRGEMRRRVAAVQETLRELRDRRRQAGQRERDLNDARADEEANHSTVDEEERTERAARAELTAIRGSAEYRAVRDLAQRRQAVQALETAARAARREAAAERRSLDALAARLAEETERVAAAVGELREEHGRLRDVARESGLDGGHLGEVPALRFVAAAADPAIQAVDVPAAANGLRQHDERIRQAAEAVAARRRAVADLRTLITKAEKAAELATRAEGDAEVLDGQLGAAKERLETLTGQLAAAGTEYSLAVQRWADHPTVRAAGVDAAPVRLAALSADEEPLPADAPDLVRQAAEAALDPVRAATQARRDGLLRDRDRAAEHLSGLESEYAHWSALTDPEPPRSRFRATGQERPAGQPLYRLVDFTEDLDERRRAGVEAALEASGLLDGWVADDGRVVSQETGDVVLRPGPPVDDSLVDTALVPVPGADHVRALLASIGFGESDAHSWVDGDGRWRLGVAHGSWRKPAAEYVGAANRAALRARRLAELRTQIEQSKAAWEAVRAELERVESLRRELDQLLGVLPDGAGLRGAWIRRDEAHNVVREATTQVTQARKRARDLRAQASERQGEVTATAQMHMLPAESDALLRVDARLRHLTDELPRHRREAAGLLSTLDRYERGFDGLAAARQRADEATARAETAAATHVEAAQELAVLEEALGADEAQIMAREVSAADRLREAEQRLPSLRNEYQEARDGRVRAERARDEALERLRDQEDLALRAGAALLHTVALPGVAPALELAVDTGTLQDSAQSPRQRIAQLDELANTIATGLGPARSDVGENALHLKYIDVRGRLTGGYDLIWEDRDGVKIVEIADDLGQHPIAPASARLGLELDQKRTALADRERQAFERFLLGELGDALSRQILAAEALVAGMNATLAEVRTSHGLGARLVWALRADADADTRAAVTLLRTPLALRTREQNNQLRGALDRRVEDARRADPSAGYAVHLRAALDYREWFTFTVKVTDQANPDRERTLSARTAMSQGEQRVVSYLVLFAAAAAHFSSVGDSHPPAPRLILLDDAFAKVDEPTHGRLLGLLVDLDLDAILTSERLWGCFPEVPSLGIYECLRDPAQPGVATLHFRWDGSRREILAP